MWWGAPDSPLLVAQPQICLSCMTEALESVPWALNPSQQPQNTCVSGHFEIMSMRNPSPPPPTGCLCPRKHRTPAAGQEKDPTSDPQPRSSSSQNWLRHSSGCQVLQWEKGELRKESAHRSACAVPGVGCERVSVLLASLRFLQLLLYKLLL